jgi:hypothetical protein
MFFGYNVGSTIHRAVEDQINIIYEPINPIVDNFIANLWGGCENVNIVTGPSETAVRPDNMMVVKQVDAPPIYYDCWLKSPDNQYEQINFMHLPEIMHIVNPLSMDRNAYHKHRHMTFVCYEENTYRYLVQELGIQRCAMINPVINPSFLMNNTSEKLKSVDLTILQNNYDLDRIQQIVNTIQTSIPSLKIQIASSNATNDYIIKILTESKMVFSIDAISIIESKYAISFQTLLLGGDSRNISYPGLVYQTPTIEDMVKTIESIMSDYSGQFNKLTLEKNKLLLDSDIKKTQESIQDILNTILQKVSA